MVGCVKTKLNFSFLVTGCQKLLEEHKEHKLYALYRKQISTEVLMMLSVKSGRMVWSVSVAGMTNKALPWGKVIGPTVGCAWCLSGKKQYFFWIRETGKRNVNLFTDALLMPTEGASMWLFEKQLEKCISKWIATTVPHYLEPKSYKNSKDDVHQYIVRKSLNKEGKKPRSKAPKTQPLVIPHILQHNKSIYLKEQSISKTRRRAQNMLNVWPRKLTISSDPPETYCQETQVLLLSVNPVKNKSLRVTNRCSGPHPGQTPLLNHRSRLPEDQVNCSGTFWFSLLAQT